MSEIGILCGWRRISKRETKKKKVLHTKNEVISNLHICRTDRMSRELTQTTKNSGWTAREKPSAVLMIIHNHSFARKWQLPKLCCYVLWAFLKLLGGQKTSCILSEPPLPQEFGQALWVTHCLSRVSSEANTRHFPLQLEQLYYLFR